MKLLLDIGNTRIKYAVDDGRGIQNSNAIIHAGQSAREVLEEIPLPEGLREIWVACVAGPRIQEIVMKWADDLWGDEPRFVHTTPEACGVTNAYAKPQNLGIDRWLGIIAAHHRGKGAACIIDAGTCLTLDVVDAKGKHLGGLIAPGVACQRDAVWGRTQVRARTHHQELQYLASSTDDAVSFGTMHGPIGLVERVMQQIVPQHNIKRLLMTGGEAELLAPHLQGWEIAPSIVLEGLARVAAEQEELP